jgi:glycosyltransferase involved in cell wall biosynthesis
MRLIVLGVPHTVTHPDFVGCAFTQKVLKFVKMMSGHGHDIIHIGHEDSLIHKSSDVTHISVTNNEVLRKSYGDDYVDNQSWKTRGFGGYYNVNDYAHTTFNQNAIKAIQDIKQPYDIIVSFWGMGHKAIADSLTDLIFIEGGIGNGSGFARWRVYESYTLRAAVEGINAVNYCNQDWYHTVIPNYFDPEDFQYEPYKQDYCLYLGRIGYNKGVDIAIEATQAAGQQLIIAGQGSLQDLGYNTTPDHVTVVGYADTQKRKELLANAASLFIASRYSEPLGGVMFEAWLSGTPVISPDWGAFGEFNQQGETGYRCRTFQHFVTAITDTRAGAINPGICRRYGMNYTLDAARPQYASYFSDVLDVYTNQGWYTLKNT